MSIQHDKLHRYLFEECAVRGELVTLSETYQQILDKHNYPEVIQKLLGEMLVATCLMTAMLKFDGDITVQIQGDGPLKMAVINGNNRQEMRGVARYQEDLPQNATLHQLVGNGYLVITIIPSEGERYQGIVGLEGTTLSECIEKYFQQSEQLPTRLWLKAGQYNGLPIAGGILLQVIPAQDHNGEDLDRLIHLTATLTDEELFSLSANETLHRLYHQEEVVHFEPQDIVFRCTCSRERCEAALSMLPEEELKELLEEDGRIDMHCDYCGTHYIFDSIDIENLRANTQDGSENIH